MNDDVKTQTREIPTQQDLITTPCAKRLMLQSIKNIDVPLYQTEGYDKGLMRQDYADFLSYSSTLYIIIGIDIERDVFSVNRKAKVS